jgi:hypothetical protein
VLQIPHHHTLVPAWQAGVPESPEDPLYVRLALGLATRYTGREPGRGRQKLFQSLDAVEPFFVHVDHHVPMIDGRTGYRSRLISCWKPVPPSRLMSCWTRLWLDGILVTVYNASLGRIVHGDSTMIFAYPLDFMGNSILIKHPVC